MEWRRERAAMRTLAPILKASGALSPSPFAQAAPRRLRSVTRERLGRGRLPAWWRLNHGLATRA